MDINNAVKLIHSESERLKHDVSTLRPDALERLTPCEGWTVADVVAHLVWFAETYGGMIERGLRGDLSPADGFPKPGTLSGVASEALYCQSALSRRQELGPTLLPTFAQTYDALNHMLDGIGPDEWDKPCYHTHGLRSVQSFLSTIIQELAIHEWDIRSSVEPSPSLSLASTPVLVEKHAQNLYRPWRVPFPRSAAASGPLRYRFDLRTGAASDRRDIVVEGDKARMELPDKAPANLYVCGDAGSFVLLLYGRLSLKSLLAEKSFKAAGDMELIDDFDRWLEGY